MGRVAKNLGASVVALGLVAGATAEASAVLTLQSGEGPTTLANDYGFTGKYYDRESGSPVNQFHPGGGPVAALFVLNADSTFSVYTDAKAGPYDNADDTQVAVLNKSSTALNSLILTGPSGLFGFDGDGISSSTYKAPGNGTDKTGYGGALAYFTGYTSTSKSGQVNFVGGLAAGTSTFFSLELAPGGNITPTAVPEPSTMISAFVGALATFGYTWRRRKAKA